MNSPSFCNVCDAEILDPESRRCPTCGVFLAPIHNPVISFDQRKDSVIVNDPFADDPLPDSAQTKPQSEALADNDEGILFIEPEAQRDGSSQENSDSAKENAEPQTAVSKLAGTQVSYQDDPLLGDGHPVQQTKETGQQSSESGTEGEGKTSGTESDIVYVQQVVNHIEGRGPRPEVTAQFEQIQVYRARSIMLSAISLTVWALLICWKTELCFVPATVSLGMAFVALGLNQSKATILTTGLSVLGVIVCYGVSFMTSSTGF